MRCANLALTLMSALALTACSKSSTGGTSTAGSGPALPPGVTPQLIAQGDSIFNNTVPQLTPCARCHGPKGAGAQNGPSLVEGPWLQIGGSYDELVTIITTGVPREKIKDASHRFAMQPRGAIMALTDPQIKALAAYVYSISRAKTS
jgi:mono/diheme cytochrome c family protein